MATECVRSFFTLTTNILGVTHGACYSVKEDGTMATKSVRF